MRRALILCLFLLLSQVAGNCSTPMFAPLQRIGTPDINNYSSNAANLTDPLVTKGNESYPDISKIENSLFGNTFANQSISARLTRIEKSLFSTSYPNSSNSQRIDNIISNYNQINKFPNISKNDLTKIEKKVFNETYPLNSSQRRIERLEEQVLGATQSGDLSKRYETLKIAVKNYRPNNGYSQDVLGQPTTGGIWRGISQALSGASFGGSMTGFTPPISPFNNSYNSSGYGNNNYNGYSNPYANQYANSSANAYPSGNGMYRGVRTNHGYSDNFKNYGCGTGVTILD